MSFVIIAIFVLIGWYAKQKHWFLDRHIRWTNHYVIWVCLPAIALLKLPALNFDLSLLYPALMGWVLLPLLAGLVVLLAKLYGWSRNLTGCLLLIVCFGNTSFVGLPIIQAFYGKHALGYAVIYDLLGSFLGLAIVGNLFIALFAGEQKANTSAIKWQVVKKVLTFPPFVAMILAFVFKGRYLNEQVTELFTLISLTLVPATMLLVGAHFRLSIDKQYRAPLLWGLGLKMILAPIVAYTVLLWFEQSQLSAQVTLMEAAMPPMVTASILAINARLAPQLAAVAVAYGMLVAVLVIPVVKALSNTL